jgi:hypothetical protein
MKLLNAFSVQMLREFPARVIFTEISRPKDLRALESAIGHPDTARVLGVKMNRVNVSLARGARAIIAQLQGGRLPEGAVELPEGFRFKWILVDVQ